MTKRYLRLIILFCGVSLLAGLHSAMAQDSNDPQGDVNTVLDPHSKDGIFNSTASYTFNVTNTFKVPQIGKVSYIVTNESGIKLRTDSVHVNIPARGSGSYDFDVKGLPPGFYKINFMINVSYYDDTTRKAFGIKPEVLRSKYARPADFEAFWQKTRQELDKVKPDYKVTEITAHGKDNRRVYRVEMNSLGGIRVVGFLTEPNVKNKNKKFAVLLGLPGYQVTLGPMYGDDPDMAIFTLNIRGSGYSRDVIDVRRQDYILLNLENKDKYVLRGAVMDCIRAVDFLYTRPELRHDNIMASGGSLGGFLSIATCALDNRISFCSAANPILGDVRNLAHQVNWPLIDIKKYIATRPGLTMAKVLDNLDYFDTKNFAPDLKCSTLVGMGMVDPIAPPDHVYVIYNNITAPKHLIVFRDLGHEVGMKFNIYEGRWMRDAFALF